MVSGVRYQQKTPETPNNYGLNFRSSQARRGRERRDSFTGPGNLRGPGSQAIKNSYHYLRQGWPTQIGLWAALGKNISLLGRILTKTEENHPKYRKIIDFRSEIGPQKFFFEPPDRRAQKRLPNQKMVNFNGARWSKN